MNTYKRLICVILVVCMVFSVGFAADNKDEQQDESKEMKMFETLLGLTQMEYYFQSNDEDALRGALKEILKNDPSKLEDALKGALDTFDPNTRYIMANDYQSTMEKVVGNYVGIGITVTVDNGKMFISNPLPDSPAEKAGLLTGDLITSIDGKDVTNLDLDSVISLIRGNAGTSITVSVNRSGQSLDFTMERSEIKLNPVTYKFLEKGIGYVKISGFTSNVAENLDAALKDLESQGVKTIILDLRNNFGGEVTQAIATASHFIPNKGLIMKETFKDKSRDLSFYSTSETVKFKPVVLINEYSASASEIVAGAIRDHKLGPLVGNVSYGKATVQTVRKVATGGAIWFTIAAYLTPNGEWIHGKGITPDYQIMNRPEKLDTSNVPQLKYNRILQQGDTGEDVLILKKNLSSLGFDRIALDDQYDDRTVQAVINVQKACGLFEYGVADVNTQLAISELLSKAEYTPDKQFDKALEIARGIK